jgi:hypothetical protein
MVLPQLAGVSNALMIKPMGIDFVYYNEVIKPALVGLAGPLDQRRYRVQLAAAPPPDHVFAGGVQAGGECRRQPQRAAERSGPHVRHQRDDDLYPAAWATPYLEIRGSFTKPTPLPQTFLWWANPAVAVNDYTNPFFRRMLHAVMDHGKRDVSRFPIAQRVYYKHDYGAV